MPEIRIKSKIQSWAIFAYALYAIKGAWLAFARPEYSPVFDYIMYIPLAICLPIGMLIVIRQKTCIKNGWLLLLPFIYFLYNLLHSYAEWDYITDIFTFSCVITFVLFKPELKARIFNFFYWVIQVCNIVSLIIFFLYILHINIGYQILPYYSFHPNQSYIRWFIFAIYEDSIQIRLCGIFNEPGGLGTLCSLLFAARFNSSRLWEKLLLIATTICTFSMAGYIIILLYIILYSISRASIKNIIALIGCLVGIIIMMTSVITHIDETSTFGKLLLRFAITSDGFTGDNRTTDEFDAVYDSFISGSHNLLGYGGGCPKPEGVLSYKSYVMDYGILGFGFWILVWTMAAVKDAKKDKHIILFLILFLLSIYQRPRLIASLYGYVLLFGGIAWMRQQKECSNHNPTT